MAPIVEQLVCQKKAVDTVLVFRYEGKRLENVLDVMLLNCLITTHDVNEQVK